MNLRLTTQLLRYVATGVLSVLLNTIIVVVLSHYLGMHYLVSIGVCFCTVTLLSFFINRRWTFEKREGKVGLDATRYFTVNFLYLLLCLILAHLLVERAGVPYPAAIVLLSILFVPINFLVHRHWSFSLPWLSR